MDTPPVTKEYKQPYAVDTPPVTKEYKQPYAVDTPPVTKEYKQPYAVDTPPVTKEYKQPYAVNAPSLQSLSSAHEDCVPADDYLSGQRDIPTQAQLAVFHSSAYLKPQDYGVETPSLALHEREAGGRVSVLDQERLSGECFNEERPLLATGRLDGLSGRVFVVR